jgi:hypothetical protein
MWIPLAPKIQKPMSKVKKLGGNDIEWSNQYENQTTHFASCTENPNANNSCYNHKMQEPHLMRDVWHDVS